MDGYYRSFHDALCVGMGRSRIGELFIIIEIKKEICRKRVLLRVERKFCVPSPRQTVRTAGMCCTACTSFARKYEQKRSAGR